MEQLYAAFLLESGGFRPQVPFDRLLDDRFLASQDDEFLLELELHASDAEALHSLFLQHWADDVYALDADALSRFLIAGMRDGFSRNPACVCRFCANCGRLWQRLPDFLRMCAPFDAFGAAVEYPEYMNSEDIAAECEKMLSFYDESPTAPRALTLCAAKALLAEHQIQFDLIEYPNAASYWKHAMRDADLRRAPAGKTVVLVVRSNNGEKHIELEFRAESADFVLQTARFGEYVWVLTEENDQTGADVADQLLQFIRKVESGDWVVVVTYDTTHPKWLETACFDRSADGENGETAFRKQCERIEKPAGFFAKLFRVRMEYEIYDWNSFRRVEK